MVDIDLVIFIEVIFLVGESVRLQDNLESMCRGYQFELLDFRLMYCPQKIKPVSVCGLLPI